MPATTIDENEKAGVRSVVFHHLSGMVLAPTVKALHDRNVFQLFANRSGWVELDQIVERTHGNRGYLRVALRLLASCGWLKQRIIESGRGSAYTLTPEGVLGISLAPPLYRDVVSFMPKAIFLEDFLFGTSDEPILPSLRELAAGSRARWGIPSRQDAVGGKVGEQIRKHVDGMVVGPAMVALARGGILAQIEEGFVNLAAIAANPASLGCIFDFLSTQGWIAFEQNSVRLTARGRYAAQIATSYGVTVSYLPLFKIVSTLLFGNPHVPRVDESGAELLVNRGMNVWGSGGAHKTYFKRVDEIIVEIFNRPLNLQPRGICDMGCGDGTFLEHLYSVVRKQTARGQVLDEHPLVVVGADFNKVARRVAKQTLRRAGIQTFHVIGRTSRCAAIR